MGWSNRFRVSSDARPAGSGDEAILNSAPYLGLGAGRSGSKNPEAGSDPAAEEIKRRQVSLVVRYVAAIRAR